MGLFDPNAYGNPMRKAALEQQSVSSSRGYFEPKPVDGSPDHSLQNGAQALSENTKIKTSKPESTTPKQPVAELANQYPLIFSEGLARSKYASQSGVVIASSPRPALVEARKPSITVSSPDNQQEVKNNISERCDNQNCSVESKTIDNAANSEEQYLSTPSRATEDKAVQFNLAHEKCGRNYTNGVAACPLQPTEVKMPTSNRRPSQTQPIVPASGNGEMQMSPEEKLVEARQKSLRRIQSRNRTKDVDNTTSLRDLDIARKPASSKTRNPLKAQRYPFHPSPSPSSNLSTAAGNMPVTPQTMTTAAQELGSRTGTCSTHSHDAPAASKPNRVHKKHSDQPPFNATKDNSSPGAAVPTILADIVAEMDKKSDAGGSSIQSNASEASGDSTRLLHDGKLFRRKTPRPPNSLADWEGKMRPPPPDWQSRSRYNSDNPEFYDDFARWNNDVANLSTGVHTGMFNPIEHVYLQDLRFHPDGMWLLLRDTVVDERLAKHYGYLEPEEVTKYVQRVKNEDFDQDWGKLDLDRPENRPIKDETTESLVANWIRNTEERRKLIASQVVQDQQALKALREIKSSPNPNRPTLNIYLRPACRTDVPQIADIYNWYVTNSPRTAEMSSVPENDIHGRLEDAISNKLPLIVAVENNKRAVVPFDMKAEFRAVDDDDDDSYLIKNVDRSEKVMKSKEKIVGWASAQDFTASDYVERISVEIEIYVDPAHRQMGIGRCLMDQLLEACDRGYLKRGGYQFHCPQDIRHLYNSGGGRDLHKIMIVLRKWRYPKKASGKPAVQNGTKKPMKKHVDDQEDEYTIWLQKWLESWGFEVEGILKGVGVKNGRFLDTVHLGRETGWQPAEGHIPDPLPMM